MIEQNYRLDKRIKVKPEDHLFNLHQHDVDLLNNHIYLMGVDRGYEIVEGTEEPGVDFAMSNRFIRNMNLCMRVNPDTPILVHMKSCGGSWHEGMAIYDAIKSCPNPITILNYTHARSMSSIIMQAANKKVTMPHGVFMFHDGTYNVDGTVKKVESEIEFYKHTRDVMLAIYCDAMKACPDFKNDAQRKRWLITQMDKKEDVFLTANEAIHYGFFDTKFNGDWKSLTIYTNDELAR